MKTLLFLALLALPAFGEEAERMQVARQFAAALRSPHTNIVTGRLLSTEERRAQNIHPPRDSNRPLHFFEITGSLHPTPRILAIPYSAGFRDPPHPADHPPRAGEEWLLILIDETSRSTHPPIGEATLIDRRYGAFPLTDNWLKLDGRLFFNELLALAAISSRSDPPQTPLGIAVARLLERP